MVDLIVFNYDYCNYALLSVDGTPNPSVKDHVNFRHQSECGAASWIVEERPSGRDVF